MIKQRVPAFNIQKSQKRTSGKLQVHFQRPKPNNRFCSSKMLNLQEEYIMKPEGIYIVTAKNFPLLQRPMKAKGVFFNVRFKTRTKTRQINNLRKDNMITNQEIEEKEKEIASLVNLLRERTEDNLKYEAYYSSRESDLITVKKLRIIYGIMNLC